MTRFVPGLRRIPKEAAIMDIQKSTPRYEPLCKMEDTVFFPLARKNVLDNH